MNCSLCTHPAEFKCKCEKPFMCPNHLGIHLKLNKNHEYEQIDIELTESQLSNLRQKLLGNLKKINKLKNDLASKTKQILKLVEKQFKKALMNLEDISKTHYQLLNRFKVCGSEMITISKIETMQINETFIEIDEIRSKVLEAYSTKLVYLTEKQDNWKDAFLNQHVGGFWCGAVSKDSKTIVTGGYDSSIRAWDLVQKSQKFVLLGHNGLVRCITLTNDSHIISGSNDASVRIWSFENRTQIAVLRGHKGGVFSLCFVENKDLIVSGDFHGELIIWDFKNYEIGKKLSVSAPIRCLMLIGSESRLIACIGKNIVFYKFRGLKEVETFQGHTSSVSCIALSSNEKVMVSGSFDNLIIVWDLVSSNERFKLTGHTRGVQSLILTPDDRYVVSGSDDQSVIVWELSSSSLMFKFNDHTSFVHSILRSDHNILSLSEDSSIGFINIEESKMRVEWLLSPFKYNSITFLPEVNYVAFGSKNDAIVWDLEARTDKKLNLDHVFNVQFVEISSDGKFVISCSLGSENNLSYYSLVKNRKIDELKGHKDSVTCASFASDGNSAASGSLDKTVRTWNLKKCKQEIEFRGHTGIVNSVKFLSNKKLLVSGGLDKNVIIWNLADKSKYTVLTGHNQIIWKVIATPDQKFVISCDLFEGIQVWNVETKKREVVFSAQTEAENWLNNNQVPLGSVREFLKVS